MTANISTNHYAVSFVGKCPVDGEAVDYVWRLQTEKLVMAEDMLEVVNGELSKSLHEQMADALFEQFGGVQRIDATHKSGRVQITTVRTE